MKDIRVCLRHDGRWMIESGFKVWRYLTFNKHDGKYRWVISTGVDEIDSWATLAEVDAALRQAGEL